MYVSCEKCGDSFDDEHVSTVCPHKEMGYCRPAPKNLNRRSFLVRGFMAALAVAAAPMVVLAEPALPVEVVTKWPEALKPISQPGISTRLGYNFYDLRGPANLIYPVNTPFRQRLRSIAK